jgi:plasmid stabilization system protein ParE
LDFELAYHRLVDAEPRQARKVARAVADEFGESLLTFSPMSDEQVEFVCRVFSDAVLVKRPGLERLLIEFYLEREKLAEAQLERVYACLCGSFGHLADEALAFAIGDFIARVALPDHALALLCEMIVKVNSRDAVSGVFLGLDILRKHHKADAVLLADIEAAAKVADARAAELKKGDE